MSADVHHRVAVSGGIPEHDGAERLVAGVGIPSDVPNGDLEVEVLPLGSDDNSRFPTRRRLRRAATPQPPRLGRSSATWLCGRPAVAGSSIGGGGTVFVMRRSSVRLRQAARSRSIHLKSRSTVGRSPPQSGEQSAAPARRPRAGLRCDCQRGRPGSPAVRGRLLRTHPPLPRRAGRC